MNPLAIIICNFNKQDFIIPCVQSVLDSSFSLFDLFVVDNASTDLSVPLLKQHFGSKISILQNSINLGGSGGFNTGLRHALSLGYSYLLLLDNDVVLAPDAIEHLYLFLQSHPEVAIVGSKIFFMDEPKQIWGYSGILDFSHFHQKDSFKNIFDSASVPSVVYGDYVAACSLMVRADAIQTVGLMPEENFIYWDDMEWGYRFRQAGYQVAAYGASKVWHKAGGRNAGTTFINYYMWRNRIRFFLNNLSMEKKEVFAESILKELFRMIYSCYLKGETAIIQSVLYALDDAIHHVVGKASEYKILPRTEKKDRIKKAFEGKTTVLIRYNEDVEGLGNIIRRFKQSCPKIKIIVYVEEEKEREKLKQAYPSCEYCKEYKPEEYESHLIMCSHILEIEGLNRDWYIDSWCNVITSEEDYDYCRNYKKMEEIFLLEHKALLVH